MGTNSIKHISALTEKGIQTCVIGGNVKETTQALIGQTTLRMLDEIFRFQN